MKKAAWITCLGVCVVLAGRNLRAAQYLLTDLGTLGGGESRALDVNVLGEVAGHSRIFVDSYAFWHGYSFRDGNMIDLETLVGASGESRAYGCNDSGQVVGWSDSASHWSRAFVWTDADGNGQADSGEMVDLGTLGGFSSAARDINDSGQVVGTAQIDGLIKYDHAFRWTDLNGNGQANAGEMIDLGTLGTSASPTHAWGINEDGAVVG